MSHAPCSLLTVIGFLSNINTASIFTPDNSFDSNGKVTLLRGTETPSPTGENSWLLDGELDSNDDMTFRLQLDMYSSSTTCNNVEIYTATFDAYTLTTESDILFTVSSNDKYFSVLADWDGVFYGAGSASTGLGGVFTYPSCSLSTTSFPSLGINENDANSLFNGYTASNNWILRDVLCNGDGENCVLMSNDIIGNLNPITVTINNDIINDQLTFKYTLGTNNDYEFECTFGDSFDQNSDVQISLTPDANEEWGINSIEMDVGCDVYTHSCIVSGDPHFLTFDGTVHHFQGNGYFDYLKVCDDEFGIEIPITISARQGDCGYGVYLCVLEIIATIADTANNELIVISFPSSGSPTFKDNGLSAIGTYYFSDNSGYYTVKNNNFEIIFNYNDGNGNQAHIKFYYSGWSFLLQTNNVLSGNICGLCGDLNDDSSDDFTRCDNNDVIDNTGSAIVKPYVNAGTAWTNTNIFGESCCNLDLDTLYLGTSNCDPNDPSDPPVIPNTECLEKAEIICNDAFYIDCTLCNNEELTDEWLTSCAMDVCAMEICETNILNDNYDVNDVRDAGCLDSVLDGCEKLCRETLTPTVMPTGSPVLPTMSPTMGRFILPQEFHKDYTWVEALEYCEDIYGTTLATVSSMEELQELSELALNMRNEDDEDDADGLKYWIGLSDIDEDGTWHWTDGRENDWDNWNTESRFRYTNNGYCAQIRYRMLNSRSTGSSIDCDQTRYFVCDSPTVA